ncbi:TonB-dependent receptor [Formosa agariphila KMM 3901]|uniref:TonB-dependent receptor n=1 Tax=Formosa agariphila (strain DSM 15362 / KCTC 12365 / LMG 23005 / KMM 3901 / M-2Alg 35-1) TaxID=1347342 RepID=T2KRF2_FORAG|nr:TonB-dependent receptor [Formosa agariphila]CDF81036.1 TonB-dependent receptor [Formosa agariphila KMM 3901]
MKNILSLLAVLVCSLTYSQTTFSGTVLDDNSQPLPGASIIIEGTTTGTVTNFDGNFNITTDRTPPFKVNASSVGFDPMVLEVTSSNQTLNFILKEGTVLDEVVISASRTPERIFESPVTIERFGQTEIKNTASADFYDGLENLKGVDINTNSLTFKSINTRGFASFSNTRFMQLVDGMDNSTPALNFPLGNLVGMTETDVLSVELLPGASSALYGANAFNGILFMRSKNPFDYSGISGYVKQGVTSQEAAGTNSYTDVGVRIAHKFSDVFAAKVNFGWLKGTDWAANNYTGKPGTGATRASADYDGYNVYGDEVATNIKAASGGLGIIPNMNVSRTGYYETDLTDYNAESLKADWGLYFRPWKDDFEISYVGKAGTGNTIYQGTNRYNIANFFQQQHKLEVKNDNFFVRGYIVADNAGDSYDMVFTGININRTWKSDQQWFGEYIQTYAAATLGGATDTQAHADARAAADQGRLIPGTSEFKAAFDKVTSEPDLTRGSQFKDASKYYHSDANYNFSHLTDWAEIQVGGSFRQYDLNSSGTIYTDSDGSIKYNEIGLYTQLQKKFLANEALKLTASLRYDKSELFDGFFSPRLSLGYTMGETDNHNIRGSVQSGFRNPTTQDLFIGLDSGRAILVGSAESNLDRDIRTYDVSASGQALGQPATVNVVGRAAYENAFSLNSVQNGAPVATNTDIVKPEQVLSFEIGYRGKIDGIIIDFSTYYNKYKDFISNETVLVPFYGTAGDNGLSLAAIQNGDYEAYQTYTNSAADVESYGASVQLSTKVFNSYDLSANYTFTKQEFDQAAYPDFRTNFNTPEHKVKASFGNVNLFTNFGFNVSWRWSDAYLWQSTFGDGDIPAYHTIDAQVNYRVPSLKSSFKLGATNLLGDEYYTAIGTGYIGSMYYVSWTINNL